MDWKRVDWLGVLSSSAADLVGGRIATAIRAAVAIWRQADDQANVNIARELDRAEVNGVEPRPDQVAGPLEVSTEDTTAVAFAMSLLAAWRRSGIDEVETFVSACVTRIRADETAIRQDLARAVYDPTEIRILCFASGLDMSRLVLQGSAESQWFAVFQHIHTQLPGQLLYLLYLAAQRAPAESRLRPW